MGNIIGMIKIDPNATVAGESNNEIVDLVPAIFGYTIPGELVVEILYMLPVKSLTRFKSVCKAWMLLINSQVFIHKHLHARNPRFGGFSLRGPKIGDSICPVEISYIVGVCNGIICLKSRSYEKPLVLFNPSTMEYSYVPPQLCAKPRLCVPAQLFVSAPGFFYLPRTQEYQIVFFWGKPDTRNVVDITTLTLGKIPSSRVAKNVSVPGRLICSGRYATSSATMFWLGLEHDSNNEILIWYDAFEERFSAMNTPSLPSDPVNRSLGVLNGSVIMFECVTLSPRSFDIWMIIDGVYGKKWMKYRTVGPLERCVYPITVCWYDRWILCSSISSKHKYNRYNLFYVDLHTDRVESFCNLQTDHVEDYKATDALIQEEFVNYQESLVSINSLLPCIDTDRPMDVY